MPEIRVPGLGQMVVQHAEEESGTGASVRSQNWEVKSGAEVYQEEREERGVAKAHVEDVQQ